MISCTTYGADTTGDMVLVTEWLETSRQPHADKMIKQVETEEMVLPRCILKTLTEEWMCTMWRKDESQRVVGVSALVIYLKEERPSSALELEWTGMGDFNSDDHYIYYCGQESLRRNGVAIMVNKRVRNAILGCSLKNDRMISVRFQGKPFNITVIQVYAPTSNAEEAEVERF